MGTFIEMTGKRFGRLTVSGQGGYNKHHQMYWVCNCDCGATKEVLGHLLRNGMTQSCGCLKKESIAAVNKSHGMSGSAIYAVWNSMLDRCHLPSSHAYNRYGGRGINVCERWRVFENFYADMGGNPDGMSLERIDNEGDYCSENVVWSTPKAQANNRRSNIVLEYRGRRQTMQQWCDELGLKIGTVWARINKYGYSVDRALTVGWRARNAY